MGDQHQRRPALGAQPRQELEHDRAGGAVEVAGRLVGEQQRRLGREGARQRDALLLAARELRRVVVSALAEADARRAVARAAVERLGAAGELERQEDVLERGQVGEQLERLEDEADAAAAQERQLVLGERLDRRAVDPHLALARPVEPGGEAEQRRLAASRRPEHGDELAARDREVDASRMVSTRSPDRSRLVSCRSSRRGTSSFIAAHLDAAPPRERRSVAREILYAGGREIFRFQNGKSFT